MAHGLSPIGSTSFGVPPSTMVKTRVQGFEERVNHLAAPAHGRVFLFSGRFLPATSTSTKAHSRTIAPARIGRSLSRDSRRAL